MSETPLDDFRALTRALDRVSGIIGLASMFPDNVSGPLKDGFKGELLDAVVAFRSLARQGDALRDIEALLAVTYGGEADDA